MFNAQYCEFIEFDHDHPCLCTVVKLKNLIRISMIAYYQEVTESDQDLSCLLIIRKLQNLIRISHVCLLSGSYRI